MCAGAWIPASVRAGGSFSRDRRLGDCAGAWIPACAGKTGWVGERPDGCGKGGFDAGWRISIFRSFPDKSGVPGPAGWPGAESGERRRVWERVALLGFLVIEHYVASVAMLNWSGPLWEVWWSDIGYSTGVLYCLARGVPGKGPLYCYREPVIPSDQRMLGPRNVEVTERAPGEVFLDSRPRSIRGQAFRGNCG